MVDDSRVSKEAAKGLERLTREAGPIRASKGDLVRIKLSAEQQSALRELTGQDIEELKILVEDLSYLADVVTN